MSKINKIIQSIDFGSGRPSEFTSEQIFNSFKQGTVNLPLFKRIGGGGNCASVALIKAAIGTFGFDNIFRSIIIDAKNERYLVDLKDDDNEIYELTFENYLYGAERSAFEKVEGKGQTEENIFEFAKFCFAVMAEVKRWEYKRNNKYARGVHDLNKGENTLYIHDYLGLSAEKVVDVSSKNLAKLKNIIVWNEPHAVYSSEGYYDEFFTGYDHTQPLSKLQEIHGDGSDKYRPIGAHILI